MSNYTLLDLNCGSTTDTNADIPFWVMERRGRVAVFNQVQMDLVGIEKRKQQIEKKKIIKFRSQMLCILLIMKRKSAYFAAKMNEYLEKKNR